MDISAKFADREPIPATSNYGQVRFSTGGVGRNVAEACHRTGGNPLFVSAVGSDFAGEGILKEMKEIGMVSCALLLIGQDTSLVSQIESSTASYDALLGSNGEMVTAVADMVILDDLKAGNVR